MPASDSKRGFAKRLAGFRRRLRFGQGILDLARFLAWAVPVLTVYILADMFLALPISVRVTINAALILATVAYWVQALWGWLQISAKDTARFLDQASGDSRKSVLTALELQHRGAPSTDIQKHLIGASTEQALARMKDLPFTRSLPLAAWMRMGRRLALCLCVPLVLLALPQGAVPQIYERLIDPRADLPPWTAYTFAVTPDPIEVHYGSDANLSVQIDGPPIEKPVVMLTRRAGEQRALTCFREGDRQFAQRLEQLTEPMEVAFAVGRARSAWHPVRVLMRPQVMMARARIIPPAYSHLPEREFEVGSQVIGGLEGSSVELTLHSNRPLGGGNAVVDMMEDDLVLDSQTVEAEVVETSTVRFTFPLRQGRVTATVRDILGTASLEPLVLSLVATEDEPPMVHIHEPGRYVMATPSVKVPILARAQDDLGLRRVTMVRTVVGFRDRAMTVGPPSVTTNYDYEDDMDLLLLGAEPGQILEFYVEAADHNPSLMGLATSEIVRVEIISEMQYAAILRARANLDAFLQRFDEIALVRGALDRALERMANAETEAARRAARDAAVDANARVASLYRRLSQDFPIFDVEQQLQAQLTDSLSTHETLDKALRRLDPNAPDFSEQATALNEAFRGKTKELDDLVEQRHTMRLMKEIMELATRYRKTVDRQRTLVRGLSRFAPQRATNDPDMMQVLGERQNEIRQELAKLQADLETFAETLRDPELAEYREGMMKLVNGIEEGEIDNLMHSAGEAAANNMGTRAHEDAALALERLEKIPDESPENAFSQMCKSGGGDSDGNQPNSGQGGGSGSGGGSLASTFQQMMQNMLNRSGLYDSSGAGGSTPTDVPVLGPERSEGSASGAGDQDGGGGAMASSRVVESTTPHQAETVAPRAGTGNAPPPPKYRDAIRRYFSTPDDN